MWSTKELSLLRFYLEVRCGQPRSFFCNDSIQTSVVSGAKGTGGQVQYLHLSENRSPVGEIANLGDSSMVPLANIWIIGAVE